MKRRHSLINSPNQVAVATTAQLIDITDFINTSTLKEEGFMVFNSTTNKVVWAIGNADGDVWVDATASTIHTPA